MYQGVPSLAGDDRPVTAYLVAAIYTDYRGTRSAFSVIIMVTRQAMTKSIDFLKIIDVCTILISETAP